MTLDTIFHNVSLKLTLFFTIAVSWLLLMLGFNGDIIRHFLELVFFSFGAAFLTVMIMHLMGYFSRFRVTPGLEDVAMNLGAVFFSGISQFGYLGVFGTVHLSLFEVLLLSPVVALVAFGAHYFHESFFLSNGKNWRRVVLLVRPHEKAELMQIFGSLGLDQFLEFATYADLKRSFLDESFTKIDQIIISRGAVREFGTDNGLIRAHLEGIPIIDRRELVADLTGRINIDDSDLWSFFMTATSQTPVLKAYSQLKVLAEPLIAVVLAVLFAPLMALIAGVVYLTSPGPILYRQRRVGHLGKPFDLIKFRSMVVESEIAGAQWASAHDSRVTPFGKVLRKTRMDELPQLLNVLRGEMSFFGPRPERPEFYRKLRTDIPLFRIRTSIRPGISGWAQVCAGYAASIEESKTKLEHDLYYIKHVSPRLDLIILAKTFLVAIGYAKKPKPVKKILRSVSKVSA